MTDPTTQAARDRARADLLAFHDDVDRRARALTHRHGTRIQCGRGCADCCRDDLSVFEVEADRIRRKHEELLNLGAPHPTGACAFLAADRSCRIYPERPYVCRTQGLPLRWFASSESGTSAEYRDICPLNLEGPRLEGLEDDACWLLGPDEERLRDIAAAFSGTALQRVALRGLFGSSR